MVPRERRRRTRRGNCNGSPVLLVWQDGMCRQVWDEMVMWMPAALSLLGAKVAQQLSCPLTGYSPAQEMLWSGSKVVMWPHLHIPMSLSIPRSAQLTKEESRRRFSRLNLP